MIISIAEGYYYFMKLDLSLDAGCKHSLFRGGHVWR